MVAGLLRGFVASSGALLLATTTVFPSMQRAGATPAAGQDYSATDLCPAELLVCTEDDICFGCISVTESSSTEFEACEEAGASSLESSDICGEGRQSMCCIDELSEYDCMGNDVYVQYVACLLVESGCSADDLSCSNEDNGEMSLGATQGEAGRSSNSNSNSNSGSSIALFVCAYLRLRVRDVCRWRWRGGDDVDQVHAQFAIVYEDTMNTRSGFETPSFPL